MTPRGWAFLAAVSLQLGCGDDGTRTSASASASAIEAASAPHPQAAPPAGPVPLAMCDLPLPDEHVCFEYFEAEIARERARACSSGQKPNQRCPEALRHSSCRLPDGSLRYTFPPKTPAQAEKACKDSRGKFAKTDTAPADSDPVEMISCEGKQAFSCEEEESYTSSRILAAIDECKSFGGTPTRKAACRREGAVGLCDLEGKRTIVFFADDTPDKEDPDERRKFCETRFGVYQELTPPAASATPSAAPAP